MKNHLPFYFLNLLKLFLTILNLPFSPPSPHSSSLILHNPFLNPGDHWLLLARQMLALEAKRDIWIAGGLKIWLISHWRPRFAIKRGNSSFSCSLCSPLPTCDIIVTLLLITKTDHDDDDDDDDEAGTGQIALQILHLCIGIALWVKAH